MDAAATITTALYATAPETMNTTTANPCMTHEAHGGQRDFVRRDRILEMVRSRPFEDILDGVE